jgi:hypothetical protein
VEWIQLSLFRHLNCRAGTSFYFLEKIKIPMLNVKAAVFILYYQDIITSTYEMFPSLPLLRRSKSGRANIIHLSFLARRLALIMCYLKHEIISIDERLINYLGKIRYLKSFHDLLKFSCLE